MAAPLIDCDVHLPAPTPGTLLQHLPSHWAEYFKAGTFQGTAALLNSIYPPGAPSTSSDDVRATLSRQPGIQLVGTREKADGTTSNNDLYFDLLRRRVLDSPGLEVAVANCYTALEGVRHPYLAADLASAVNDWVATEWLSRDQRLKASIAVAVQFPDSAVKEIERLATDTRFVQVLVPARSPEPYGTRRYWPIFEAAAKHGLVIALHFGGLAGIPPTSSGWPSYYLEEFVGMAQIFQAQVTSLVISGVLEEYPDLRISLNEGGFTWLPTLVWHLDKRWKGLRRDVPWVHHEPSTYIREHMRATIQPADAPPTPEALLDVVEALGSSAFLLYSTDFPHVHATSSDDFLAALPAEMIAGVRSINARSFFPDLAGSLLSRTPDVAKYIVARVEDMPAGNRLIVEVAGRSIGVFNVDGEFYALRNRCPHNGGPLCEGGPVYNLLDSPRPGEYTVDASRNFIACPWHGWEYDITTGQSWFDPVGSRVRSYAVSVVSGAGLPSLTGVATAKRVPGPYVAETYKVSVDDKFVVVDVTE